MTFEFPRERAVQGDVDYFSYSPASDPLRPLLNDPEEDYCDETAGTDDFDDSDEEFSDKTTADWHEDEASGRPVAYYPRCNQRSGLRDDSPPLPLAFLLLLLFFYMGYNDRDSTALKLSCRTGVQ